MDYLEQIPDKLVAEITALDDIAELNSMRIRYRGAKNVWVRLAIDERIKNIKHRSVN